MFIRVLFFFAGHKKNIENFKRGWSYFDNIFMVRGQPHFKINFMVRRWPYYGIDFMDPRW